MFEKVKYKIDSVNFEKGINFIKDQYNVG